MTDDDFASDIIGEYFERFDDGEDPKQIRKVLEETNSASINDSDEGHIFWFALAKAQWDIGELDKDVLNRVVDIVESDIDTKVWVALDGKNPEKRQNSIREFAQKIQTPREKPRKRKRKILKSSPFEAGDVLIFKTIDTNYGVAVVLDAEKNTQFATTDLVFLKMKQKKKPTMEEIVSAEVLIFFTAVNGYPEHIIESYHCSIYTPKKDEAVYKNIEVLGKLKIKKLRYPVTAYTGWNGLSEGFEYRIERPSPQKISLKKYLGYSPLQKITLV